MDLLVKVCGMTDGDNIRRVEALGVDFIGFVFHEPSPRYAGVVPSYLPERAKRVGVFVDSPRKEVERKAERFGLQVLQLHGGESPDYCRRLRETLGLPLVKAFHLAETEDLRRTEPYEGLCDFFLFEPLTCLPGGSGKTPARRSTGNCSTLMKAGRPSCSAGASGRTAQKPCAAFAIPAGRAST